jgi:5-hydroxyisourate hydrolase
MSADGPMSADVPMSAAPKLTTHVLDVSRGRPAAGVEVVVARVGDDGEPVVLVETRTNDDGRTDAPLLVGDDFAPGRYELTFAVGDHFDATGALGPGATRYLDLVPVHIGVGPETGSVHLALLVTPWSYTTYRGS